MPLRCAYTEARMTNVAKLLLDGIDEDAIDFRPTYDGEAEEPVLLPAVSKFTCKRRTGYSSGYGNSHPAT